MPRNIKLNYNSSIKNSVNLTDGSFYYVEPNADDEFLFSPRNADIAVNFMEEINRFEAIKRRKLTYKEVEGIKKQVL
jgi:hypothetical protein